MGNFAGAEVTIWNVDGTSLSTVTRDSTSSGLPAAATGGEALVLIGGVQAGSPRTYRSFDMDSAGRPAARLYDASGNAISTVVQGAQRGLVTASYDAAGNPLSVADGAAIGGTQGGILAMGRDEVGNAQQVSVDTAGRPGVRLRNRDGQAIEGVFGAVRTTHDQVFLDVNFSSGLISPHVHQELYGSTSALSVVNAKLRVSSGTAVGAARARSRAAEAYVGGVGVVGHISVILGDTGSAGNVREWGMMSPDGVNGYFFRLNGTTLEAVRRSNGADTAVAAASWNIDNTITPDTNGHIWSIHYQWLGVGRIVFGRDGRDVHTIEYAGTSAELSSRNPNMGVWLRSTNTSTQGGARYLEVGCFSLQMESPTSRDRMVTRYRMATDSVAVTTGGYRSILGLRFRPTKSGAANMRTARVRRVAFASTNTVLWRIRKNAQLSGVTPTGDNLIQNPDTEWSGHTNPLTRTLSGTNATGTGYADGNTVAYRITAVGPLGETLPATATATLAVGTPRKQVLVEWNPITFAASYRVYRQLNGAGNFELVGTTSSLSFTDDAYTAQTGVVPPGANTTDGESFMERWDGTSVVANGGRTILSLPAGADSFVNADGDSEEYLLLPGETLIIEVDPNTSTSVSVIVEWDEGAA